MKLPKEKSTSKIDYTVKCDSFNQSKIEAPDIKIVFLSIPVEGVGSKLDRGRDQGSLGIVPKVAIVALVTWLLNNGYTDKNWDFIDVDMLFPDDDFLYQYFHINKPEIAALSAVVSTSYSQVKRISNIIREASPNTWIEMGGNLAASSEAVLFNTNVDVTIVGDGEISFKAFVDYVVKNGKSKISEELRKIPGICFIEEDGSLFFEQYGPPVPAKNLVLPDYKILERGLRWDQSAVNNYFRKGLDSGWFNTDSRALEKNRRANIAGIFASKGCVARCTFCQRNTKSYRVHPYDELDVHLKMLAEKYNVGFIQILDENFGSNREHSREFAKILWKNNMLWMATGVRCTNITEDDIIFYKQHGCSALKFGVESGSQIILDLMEKFFSLDDVYKAIQICIKHNIYSPLGVMVGMPGETEQTAMETGRLIGKVATMLGVKPQKMGYDIFYALPLPGTPLYEYGEYYGVIDKSPEGTGEYLERVTDAGTYKRYYVNLNGAHESEVVFWDVLVALEASRTYHNNLRYNPNKPSYSIKATLKSFEDIVKNNPRYNLKYTALSFTFITFFVDNYVIGSRLIDTLPRFIIYPIIKYLLYLEFFIQSLNKSNTQNNIFAMNGKKVPRLIFSKYSHNKNPKKRSLRAIVTELSEMCKITNNGNSFISDSHVNARQLLVRGL